MLRCEPSPQMDNWCQVHCLNPARRHRKLKRLLEDWCNLHTHAINCDTNPTVSSLVFACIRNCRCTSVRLHILHYACV